MDGLLAGWLDEWKEGGRIVRRDWFLWRKESSLPSQDNN
jgi:hypothetical protein